MAEPLAHVQVGGRLAGLALLQTRGRDGGVRQAAVLADGGHRVRPVALGVFRRDPRAPSEADLAVEALQRVRAGSQIVLDVRRADGHVIAELLAGPAPVGGLLEGAHQGLVVHLDEDRVAREELRVHERAARGDAADRPLERQPPFLVLDRVVQACSLPLAAQGEAGVLVPHHQGDLLAPLDEVLLSQVVEGSSGGTQLVAEVRLPHLRLEQDDARGGRPVGRPAGRLVNDPRAVEGPLVRGQLGVGQREGVVPVQRLERFSLQRQVELAAALGVVHDGAVVAVDGVELVRVEVGEQAALVLHLEIAEDRSGLPPVAVVRRRDQVLAGHRPLEIDGQPSFRLELAIFLEAGGFGEPVSLQPADRPVREGHQEERRWSHGDGALEPADPPLAIGHLDQQPAAARGKVDGPGEGSVARDLDAPAVDRHPASRIRPAREAERVRGQDGIGGGQIDREVWDPLLGDHREAVLVAVGDHRDREAGDARATLPVADQDAEDRLARRQLQIGGESPVRRHLQRRAVELHAVARLRRAAKPAGGRGLPGGHAGLGGARRDAADFVGRAERQDTPPHG